MILTAAVLSGPSQAMAHVPGDFSGIGTIAAAAKAEANGFCALLFAKVRDVSEFRNGIRQLDIRDFARRTNEAGQELSFKVESGRFQLMEDSIARGEVTADEALAKLLETAKTEGKSSWEFSLIPREIHRLAGMHYDTAITGLHDQGLGSKPRWLVDPSPRFERSKWEQKLGAARDKIKADGPIGHEETGQPGVVQFSVLCAQYGIFDTIACAKSLKHIVQEMQPYLAHVRVGFLNLETAVAMPDRIVDFILDWRNHEALRLAASRVWDQITKTAPAGSNLYDTVLDSFRKVGFSPMESEERVWKFLALYATRGANIGPTIAHFTATTELEPLAGIFSVLAHGTGILDARALTEGRPMFSYPKGVHSTIDNSKPYHFWMSAYWARETARLTGNRSAGRDAAWLAQLGYQMRSKTSGRDPTRSFTVEPFDTANNKIRMDLAYAAAGARFGERSLSGNATETVYDVDGAFRQLLLSGEALEPVSPEKAERLWSGTGKDGYFRWRRIFNPDAALRYYGD